MLFFVFPFTDTEQLNGRHVIKSFVCQMAGMSGQLQLHFGFIIIDRCILHQIAAVMHVSLCYPIFHKGCGRKEFQPLYCESKWKCVELEQDCVVDITFGV